MHYVNLSGHNTGIKWFKWGLPPLGRPQRTGGLIHTWSLRGIGIWAIRPLVNPKANILGVDIDLLENEELPCEILDHLLKFKLSRLLVWTIRTRDRKQQSNMGTEHNIGTKQFTENDKYKTID